MAKSLCFLAVNAKKVLDLGARGYRVTPILAPTEIENLPAKSTR